MMQTFNSHWQDWSSGQEVKAISQLKVHKDEKNIILLMEFGKDIESNTTPLTGGCRDLTVKPISFMW